jgi:hypothetical protein
MERGFELGIKWSLGLFRIVLGCNWVTTVTCRMERQENVFTYKGLLLTGIMHKYIHELRIWVPFWGLSTNKRCPFSKSRKNWACGYEQ